MILHKKIEDTAAAAVAQMTTRCDDNDECLLAQSFNGIRRQPVFDMKYIFSLDYVFLGCALIRFIHLKHTLGECVWWWCQYEKSLYKGLVSIFYTLVYIFISGNLQI